jgi:hypothetical protein
LHVFFLAVAMGRLFGDVLALLLKLGDTFLQAAFFLGEALLTPEKLLMRCAYKR